MFTSFSFVPWIILHVIRAFVSSSHSQRYRVIYFNLMSYRRLHCNSKHKRWNEIAELERDAYSIAKRHRTIVQYSSTNLTGWAAILVFCARGALNPKMISIVLFLSSPSLLPPLLKQIHDLKAINRFKWKKNHHFDRIYYRNTSHTRYFIRIKFWISGFQNMNQFSLGLRSHFVTVCDSRHPVPCLHSA